MDEYELNKFNEQIINAFKVKVEKSNKIISDLEQDVKVKEVELNFLAKKYDEEITQLNKIVEKFKEQIQELKKELSKKENETKLLNNNLMELKEEFASTKEEIKSSKYLK